MDKKILWIISFLLIAILLIKVDPFSNDQIDLDKDQVVESNDTQDSEDASPYEKSYFLSHPVQATAPDFAAITDVKERKKSIFQLPKTLYR